MESQPQSIPQSLPPSFVANLLWRMGAKGWKFLGFISLGISDKSEFLFPFVISKSLTSCLCFTSVISPLPFRAMVAITHFSESKMSIKIFWNLSDRHSIFPISSIIIRPDEGSRNDIPSRNSSKLLISTLYRPTL